MTEPINWGQLQQNSKGALDPVPDGEYHAKIVDAQAVKASTGKLMFSVKWELTEGPHIKRRIKTNMVVSDDSAVALAIFFRQMDALGIDGNFFAQNPAPAQVASAMLNRSARITVGHKVWQGIDRNEIRGVMPSLTGGPVAPGSTTGPATLLPSTGATPSAMATPTTPSTTPKPPSTTPKPPVSSAPPLPI